MNRYLLFVWDQYYPSGGFNDYYSDFESEEEALACWAQMNSRDYGQIVDLVTGNTRDLYR